MPKLSRFFMAMYACTLFWMPMTTPAAETTDAGNTYLAGGDLKIREPVPADLIVAGGRISVEQDIGADAAIAGGSVDIRSSVTEDLRVAGGTVDIEQTIGGDLVAAGGTVTVDDSAAIGGSAWLAGSEVNVAGKIGKGAKIYGNRITLSGQINGDTRMYGQEIVLTPQARINGNLSYASAEPLSTEQEAQVSGTVTRLQSPEGWESRVSGTYTLSWFHPLFFISMLICGMLLYLLFPRAVIGTEQAIGQHPVRSLLLGLALLFTIPPVAVLFMATVVGLPIGFVLLLLYPLSLLLGYLGTAFFLSRQVGVAMKHQEPFTAKKQVLFLALALLLLSLALAVPFLGGFILLVAVVIGIGGWAVWTLTRFRSGREMPE